MRSSLSQIILDFEPLAPRENKVLLRICHSEQEYFNAKREPVPKFPVDLPRPFQETAFMDPGGWRQTPLWEGPARDLGNRMWSNLPASVRDAILAGSPDTPQRVAILSTASGLEGVPWEWLNAGPEALIAATASVRFVRLVPTLYATPPLTVTPPIRVLIILTNPKDERLLDPVTEVDIIMQGLMNGQEYEVRQLVEPRLEALQRELEWAPHVIHYVGHSGISGTEGCLILHDDRDGTRWLAAAEIARLLPDSVQLVCLSTCVTAENYQTGGLARFAHCSAEIPLPTTIVNQYALKEPQARAFWGMFYPALYRHEGNVVEALHEARTATCRGESNTWSWASFSLVVRDGIGQPFRIARAPRPHEDRFAVEVQARWSARLTNNIATRIRSLGPDAQVGWEDTLADESARLESLEREIETREGAEADAI
jgi:hypothetical protein